ncbi:MAG: cytidine deaminase [Acidaminococcaceae bacterium]|nr:cytidine deaminase [Acidaminococcaceae bacterium]
MTDRELYQAAVAAREKAYAPFSGFAVGAAVLTASGNIYTGCNIENSSFGLTCCAERVAIFNAVSKGERDFEVLCVVADTAEPVAPCGACRQVAAEFGVRRVLLGNLSGAVKEFSLQELLPYGFSL